MTAPDLKALERDRLEITLPGVYDDIPEDVYHAHPALSSTGARDLLAPSCPAKFRYKCDNPQPPSRTFDMGKAAHKHVLGTGPELVVVDADNYRTKAAQQARDEAYAAGAVPLLPAEYEQVQEMTGALRAHPLASALFDPARGGRGEQSLFWTDRDTGIMRRARLDWLPPVINGRMIIPDYKTTVSAEPAAIRKAIHTYRYNQQADWYRDGAYELGLAQDVRFLFVFQEKTAPYVVTVVEPDADALAWGDVRNRAAISIYQRCMETGYWPGYSDDVVLTELPVYAVKEYEAAQARGDYDVKVSQR